jgi:hypothetical protein
MASMMEQIHKRMGIIACNINMLGLSFRKTFLLLLFFHSSVFSWNISSESLKKKLQNDPTPWMLQGIERDLLSFNQGFSQSDILACLEKLKRVQGIELAGLISIHFTNGKGSAVPLVALNPEQLAHCNGFLSALSQLHCIAPLPDLHLILCVSSSFDRPLLLRETSVPILAVSKERYNRKVVLVPRLWSPEREILFPPIAFNWNEKIEKAFWRGSPTDGPYGFFDWDCRPRARLVLSARYHNALIDASFIAPTALNAYMTQWLKNLHLFSSFITPEQQAAYKYLISLDGKSSPSSFEWQLFSQSLIFKASSSRIEWFYHALLPGVHFIAFAPNGQDLIEKILWAKTHDREAREIAETSHFFAMHNLLDEDALVYLYHLLHRYAKLSFLF